MSAILYKDNPYGGTTTVTDAGHVLVTEGSDTTTAQAKFNTQTTAIQRILGNFATVEESTTASKAYNVGDYLVLNSFLYKVTQVIAAGDTIDNTQNGNVEKTNAGEEFKNALITNSASGAIASFPDGADDFPVRDLKVQIEPIQDLHGYDHPWPAGGGKNLLPMTIDGIKAANTSGTWNGNAYTINGITFTIHAGVDGSVTDIIANGTATANANLYLLDNINSNEYPFAGMILNGGASSSEYVRIELEVSPWTVYATSGTAEQTIDPAVSQQGTNKILTFLRVLSGYTSSNSVFKPMIRLASESDSTFYPYSNVCPISGRGSVTVMRTGKNLFGGTFNEFFPLHFESDKTVIASADAVGSGTPQMGFYDENKVRIDYWGMDSAHSSVSGRVARVIELPKESYYVKFIGNESTRYMIELGNTNTTFKSYVGNTYNITFPSEAGTVYGGTLDVTTGVLTVTMAEVDLGTFNWNRNPYDIGGYYYFRSGTFSNWKNGSYPNFNCSQYSNAVSRLDMNDKTIAPYTSTTYDEIFVRDDAYIDAATFKSAMSGVQFCYELANPQTYTLTSQQMTTLLGQNNVWSDADSISLEYATNNYVWDTLHKIDTNIQNLEASDIAYDNSTSGLTADNVQDALNELNSNAITRNLKSITRITATVTTGATGNINLPYANDGLTHIIAPCANGYDVFFRTWVAGSNGNWFLTAINPNTGATINNTSINIRYLVVKLYSAS